MVHPTEFSSLTSREREVLRLVSQGRSNTQIAEVLNIAEITVRIHLRNIYGKIGARTRTEAVRFAIQNGLGE